MSPKQTTKRRTNKTTKTKPETKTYSDSLFFCQLKDAMTASVETENNQ
jgi:hypothetical protein